MTLHFTCENRRDDQTFLRVSTRALDRAHAATDPVLHQSVSEGKVAGETLKAPIVGAYEGRLSFENGRHRACAALRQGLKVIPVIVDRDNAPGEVRKLLVKFRRLSPAARS